MKKDPAQKRRFYREQYLQLNEIDASKLMRVVNLTNQINTTVHRRLKELVEAQILERRGEGQTVLHCHIPNLK